MSRRRGGNRNRRDGLFDMFPNVPAETLQSLRSRMYSLRDEKIINCALEISAALTARDHHRATLIPPALPHPESSPTFFDRLPDDILVLILSFLKPKPDGKTILSKAHAIELIKASLICRRFRIKVIAGNSVVQEAARRACIDYDIEGSRKHTLSWIHRLGTACPFKECDGFPRKLYENWLWGYHFPRVVERKERPREVILKWWGMIDEKLRRDVTSYNICVDGEGLVSMADGSEKPVKELRPGDRVRSEFGDSTLARVLRQEIHGPKPLVAWRGFLITPCHPLQHEGAWYHPEELAAPERRHIDSLYNLELGDDARATGDHAVRINGVLVATLGKDVGPRLKARKPQLDSAYGTGYWTSPPYKAYLEKLGMAPAETM
eukprot:gnl/Trimastix_PCT/493.p1 GENE.gnl/Trimastix_PCT/493~~gnl/Trimastix_PCT/493.p1  ORF type:complete len:378 (+),score=106.51 gnl/Trimastix_PCT/493:114-1247(+)